MHACPLHMRMVHHVVEERAEPAHTQSHMQPKLIWKLPCVRAHRSIFIQFGTPAVRATTLRMPCSLCMPPLFLGILPHSTINSTHAKLCTTQHLPSIMLRYLRPHVSMPHAGLGRGLVATSALSPGDLVVVSPATLWLEGGWSTAPEPEALQLEVIEGGGLSAAQVRRHDCFLEDLILPSSILVSCRVCRHAWPIYAMHCRSLSAAAASRRVILQSWKQPLNSVPRHCAMPVLRAEACGAHVG